MIFLVAERAQRFGRPLNRKSWRLPLPKVLATSATESFCDFGYVAVIFLVAERAAAFRSYLNRKSWRLPLPSFRGRNRKSWRLPLPKVLATSATLP